MNRKTEKGDNRIAAFFLLSMNICSLTRLRRSVAKKVLIGPKPDS